MKKRLTSSITSVGACVTEHNTMKHYHPCIVCRNKATIVNGKSEKFDFCDTCVLKELFEKLKEYEDAEEQGLLVKLPCKAGDTVYIVEYAYNRVVDWELGGFMIFNNKIIAYSPRREYLGVFGQKVFLTKSEAEQALVKLEREENK
jgi:hypothetical protein